MGSRVEAEAIYNVDHEYLTKYTAPKERKKTRVYRETDNKDHRKTALESLRDFINGFDEKN